MADWYYYNESGEKIGPVRCRELKQLALNGTVMPDTKIEDDFGHTAPAKLLAKNLAKYVLITLPPEWRTTTRK